MPIIVKILFGYGAFSSIDEDLTVKAARYYVLALPFIFLWPIYYRIFQIKDRISYLIPIVGVAIFINGCLNALFILEMKIGLEGIALATDIAYLFLVVISLIILRRLSKNTETFHK